jgi:DNA-binding transcriptional ArsR family regulator
MTRAEQHVRVETPEQREAMRHPTRHRMTLAMREPMKVSALARELRVNKGNVAHHVAVLERVGLVEQAGRITGRGGTGMLYRSAPLRLGGRGATAGMLQAVSDGVLADDGAFALLRSVRLTPAQARSVAEHVEQLLLDLPAQQNAPRHGIFITVFRL